MCSYHKILDWEHIKDYDSMAVWKSNHPNYTDFKEKLKELLDVGSDNIIHNLYDI